MKIALYIRISKADGSQDTARQIHQLRDFAKSQNWKIVEEIEEHISGSKTNRSGTQRLIKLAKGNKIQKVLIHEATRLGRNTADTYNTVEELCKLKVSVYDYNQRQETLNQNLEKSLYGTVLLPLLASLSEQWMQQHVYRIKSGLEEAKRKGIRIGRPKQEKQKKEKEILEIRKRGFIEDEFGRKKKASYGNISKYLGLAQETVRSVLLKHGLGGRIEKIVPEKTMRVKLSVCIYNNSKFVRGMKKAYQDVERFVLPRYDVKGAEFKDLGDNEYSFKVTYKDQEDLDEQMYDLLSEIADEADSRHCHTDDTTIYSLDDEDLRW